MYYTCVYIYIYIHNYTHIIDDFLRPALRSQPCKQTKQLVSTHKPCVAYEA